MDALRHARIRVRDARDYCEATPREASQGELNDVVDTLINRLEEIEELLAEAAKEERWLP